MRFAKEYMNKPDYPIKIVLSLVPKGSQPLIEGDHAFMGATYQDALKTDIEEIRNEIYKA